MTFDAFIAKYDGKGIDWDGQFGNQCVDLYRQYAKEVLGFPQSPPVPGAKDVWNTYLADKYERIDNTPSGVPQKGDIVIWGAKYGPFGHIAVFLEGDASKFKSFDQNDPVGTKCHIQEHKSYTGVLGWLRPRVQPPVEEFKWFKGLLTENGIALSDAEGRTREIFDQAKKYEQAQKERDKAIRDASEAKGKWTEYEEKFLAEQKVNLRQDEEIRDLRNKVSDRDSTITALRQQLDDCQGHTIPQPTPTPNWFTKLLDWLLRRG